METVGRLIIILLLTSVIGCSLPIACQLRKIDHCLNNGLDFERKEFLGKVYKVNCKQKDKFCKYNRL